MGEVKAGRGSILSTLIRNRIGLGSRAMDKNQCRLLRRELNKKDKLLF